jgi:hypothetical protein
MMDYDAIVAQVLALLQQEQRLAYRVLKRRFQLDDDLLEDLKDDLIYAKKVAVDEDGRVLVWTGGTAGSPRDRWLQQEQGGTAADGKGAKARRGGDKECSHQRERSGACNVPVSRGAR